MLSNSQSSRFLALSKSSSSIELRQLNTPTRQVTVHHRGHPGYRPDTDGQKKIAHIFGPNQSNDRTEKNEIEKNGCEIPPQSIFITK